jgi:hypothetical protein
MPQNYGALEKVLRVGEGRRLKRLASQADYVASLEPDFERLSDAELAAKTVEFRQRLENGETLGDLAYEAFAAVREAAKRSLGMRHFDVQAMGAFVLHEGDIAEMKTGEGKTLVATMPLYLNALPGDGVHLVTVNDYLAKRDAEWMGPVYEALGMRAAFIRNQMPFAERKEAYGADITYGTNSEFGFDYLRDNMATSLEGTVQRSHSYAIVDEVDSILIDEARTPLIISGEPQTAASTYYDFARIVRTLKGVPTKFVPKGVEKTEDDADYEFDEKFKTVSPRQSAIDTVERAVRIDNLYEPQHAQLVNHLIQALKAQSLYQRDVDYVVQDGEVKIVDEFTGRIMEGRRWSEGLHQAVEAKEGVAIKEEHVTLATITLQNYFRLYEKLAGMTGTAKTEEKEFQEIYDLSVVEIPTNVPVARNDENDYIYKTKEAKYDAVVADIAERHELGQPVLVGTISVEVSEHLSRLLERQGVPHNVLNAKQHEREAQIIIDAGEPGRQTRRMLKDERIERLATEFGGNWLDFRRFGEHNAVDRTQFPQFTDELRQAMFEEPIRFFVDVAQHDRSVLEFLDADHTFVNRHLAEHYGLSGLKFEGEKWQRVEGLAERHRGGLLPMAVFLTRNSPGLRTSPVKRGYWVVRRLLGEEIPPPPPDVPELPQDERGLGELTLAEVLARHRDHASCAGCHDRFDSIGLVFENFGPIGEWRTDDLGGRPVSSEATFPDGSRGNGVAGLRRYMREQRQEEYLDNFCRKLLSYALGRTPLLSDEPLIEQMRFNLERDGFRFSSLIESIVTSRQFLHKRGSDRLGRE